MRRHLLILLVVTVLVRCIMFISFPLYGSDDNQASQSYLIGEIVKGNWLIGNLRFNTGYPLVISPVAALADRFKPLDDHILLTFQTFLASLIPFMLYDILRQRRTLREAFAVALFVALDPFGWQWANLFLPVWLVAFLTVLALWLIQRGLRTQDVILYIMLAGLVLGFAVLARINFAPAVAALGLTFFALGHSAIRKRLVMFATLGFSSFGILILYLGLIHFPSTGTWSLSCIGAQNLLVSIVTKGVPVVPENGPATRELLHLLTLEPRNMTLYSGTYPRWKEPGSWATQDEQAVFFNQEPGPPDDELPTVFPGTLFYFMGPCATDDLLRAVDWEALSAHPAQWFGGLLGSLGEMIVQQPQNFDLSYLPRYIEITPSNNSAPLMGFQRVEGGDLAAYNGHLVWLPGMWLYSGLLDNLHLLKWLLPLAIIQAWRSGEWFYRALVVVMLVFFVFTAAAARAETRYIATVYPLTATLLGYLLYEVVMWIAAYRRRQSSGR